MSMNCFEFVLNCFAELFCGCFAESGEVTAKRGLPQKAALH